MSSPAPTSTAAIVSLVSGILSWIMLPLLAGLVAVVCGHIARAEIRRTGMEGDSLALIGLILGYLNIGLALLFVLAVLFGMLSLGLLAALFSAT